MPSSSLCIGECPGCTRDGSSTTTLEKDYIPALLEFAILDFNLVQSIYKEELQEMSRWWRSLDLVCDDLHFIRDRLVENYLWAAGFSFLPEFGKCRTAITKMNCL
ncbi:hypothetical protein HPP92_026403 [Vanilla planifolia]|uniref:Terpene synthase metal-binding domain-containing protein n=1 Tax=Vanilla planifolia TaxID=51239 RepID=A0A835PCF3_VANPL|nr:hypothetical protein HPP92_026403 [Vanilla planifolia]